MQAERDELLKFIFPQLRRICEQRGVIWGEVDLRWGVTDEQAAEGKVLPICLEEIQRCRPYFIGLLGERYGWLPEEIPQDLVEREPWLAEHRHRSVTELEILHGVLNDPAMAGQAYFYFRDPTYLRSFPVSEQKAYLEEATQKEKLDYGAQEAERRAEDRRHKLAMLKARIRASGLPVRENYADPHALGQLVLQDLTAAIDHLFPEGTQPDPLDRAASDHDAFAQKRTGVYIRRQEYFDRLEAHMRSGAQPLTILGGPGAGKSALLANWASGYREKHLDELVLMHFIGAVTDSGDWMAMLRRIMGEFKRRFEIRQEIPDNADALRTAFANWLHMAAARGRVVLILDGLDQLDDYAGAPDLVWLPPEIPTNIRVVLSTLPGRPYDEITRRGWETQQIETLALEERKKLIQEFLAQFSKALTPAQVERIASSPRSANPQCLRSLLEELRVFGVHEQLDERINYYLDAKTVEALFERILARCEADYERERPGLVGEALSLLWASRQGLTESELLELLGSDGQPLPHAYWSPLRLTLEANLLDLGGLIQIPQAYFREAVKTRYLQSVEQKTRFHLRIADYFGLLTWKALLSIFTSHSWTLRSLEERPWQLLQANAWERLYQLLADKTGFQLAWDRDPNEVKRYWAALEKSSPFRMVAAYYPPRDEFKEDIETLRHLVALFHDFGYLQQALGLSNLILERDAAAGNDGNRSASLNARAGMLRALRDFDGAQRDLLEFLSIARRSKDKASLALALGNLGAVLTEKGELDQAMVYLKEEEAIVRPQGWKGGLQSCLGNQARILAERGDLEGAMKLHREEERLCLEMGNREQLSVCQLNQADVLRRGGELMAAMSLLQKVEAICRQLGQRDRLQRVLGGQADIFFEQGEMDEALALYQEQEGLSRDLGNHRALHLSLQRQALIRKAQGDLDGAMNLLLEEERICVEIGDTLGLASSLGNQANILRRRGDFKKSLAFMKKEEGICRDEKENDELARCLVNQAYLFEQTGRPAEGIPLLEEAYELAKNNGLDALLPVIRSELDQLQMDVNWPKT